MKLVLLTGDGAVGKMTVGQELAKITDLRLFHNHISIEPVLEVFAEINKEVITKTHEIIILTKSGYFLAFFILFSLLC